MARIRRIAVAVGVVSVAAAVIRHRGAVSGGRTVAGGVVMDDAGSYDAMSRLLFGSLFAGIAADVAAQAQPGDAVLEVGCGPGHLALRLAREHGLAVTGLDLDPAMIARARRNAAREQATDGQPDFVVGDVAALPFDDDSFALVVSTMSMHHWDDPAAGLAEISRVLSPGGRALIWDIGPRGLPFHSRVSDPLAHAAGTGLEVVTATDWHWPWRFSFSRRTEFRRAD